MMTVNLRSLISNKAGAAGEKEILIRCGEVVPLSGIYEFLHPSHNDAQESEMVVAIRGELVQPCPACGEQVQLRLLHAAPHISEDHDFCGADAQPQKH